MDFQGHTITVRELIDRDLRLGIPHFQRGLVWGTASMSALMESLYYDTPCGSFVFWRPRRPEEHGVPLDERGSALGGMEYLVVDGQQRIRSIRSAYDDARLDDEDDADDDTAQPSPTEERRRRIWCVNLTKAPSFRGLVPEPRRDNAMFVYAVDPIIANKRSPYRYNLLPFAGIREDWARWEEVPASYRALVQLLDTGSEDSSSAVARAYEDLRGTIQAMAGRVFFVARKETDDLAEMVDLYNRINSGGKRVEIEERAFARLVALHPDSWRRVTALFEVVHGKGTSDPGNSDKMQRDLALERRRESQFGFKLFIRVFLQVCHYHFGYSLGANPFSFDIARKEGFLRRLGGVEPDKLRSLWDETHAVVSCLDGVLRDPLCCDDLRFLPEILGLAPIFQLLIQYPTLRGKEFRNLLGAIALRLLLASMDGRKVAAMLASMRDPGVLAFDVIPGMLAELRKNVDEALPGALTKAESIQDKYVLLLYWLERSLGARDFDYSQLPNLVHQKGRELPVGRNGGGDEISEKQHMVPFSRLVDLLGDEDARRSGSHRFNSLGNLTYISRRLNSFETGLGSAPVDLGGENRSNQRAHLFLHPDSGDDRALRAYQTIFHILTDGDTAVSKGGDSLDREFGAMCDARRANVLAAFRRWLDDLDQRAAADLGLTSAEQLAPGTRAPKRIEPALPLCVELKYQRPDLLVRVPDLPNEVEDRLVEVTRTAKRVVPREGGGVRVYLTGKRASESNDVRIDATLDSVVLHLPAEIPLGYREKIRDVLGLGDTPGAEIVLYHAGMEDLRPLAKISILAEWVAKEEAGIREGIKGERERRRAQRDNKRASVDWDLPSFRSVLEASGAARGFIEFVESVFAIGSRAGIEVEWGKGEVGALMLKVDGKKVIQCNTDATVRFRPDQFSQALGETVGEQYREKLSRLLPEMSSPRVSSTLGELRVVIDATRVEEVSDRLLAVLDDAVKAVEQAVRRQGGKNE